MKFFRCFTLLIVLFNIGFAQKRYTGQSIEDILKLPEEEISVSIATVVLAKEFYPELNIPFFLQTFDYLADRFKYYFGSYTNPDERIRALNTYLYKSGVWNDSITFSYDDDDLHASKLDNKFINGYLASKKGSCITMPMLYMILGEKLGFPIKAVRSPKHFFVRYIPKDIIIDFQQNIEATNGGGYIPDLQYKEDVFIPDKAIDNGVYLRTLTKKEYIASLLLINGNEYIQRNEIEKAKHYFKLAIKYDPTFSSAYMNYGVAVFDEAQVIEKRMWKEQEEAVKQIRRAASLAFTKKEEPPKTKNNEIFESEASRMANEQMPKPKVQANENVERTIATVEIKREIEERLDAIAEKYKPEIMAKIAEYKKYTGKAKELGIVLKFPLQFFQKQAESIKQYRESGGY